MSGTESDLLNDWFAGQRQYRTWNELADYLGLDKRVMSHYHTGMRRVINPDHRALLFKVTKIPVFANEKPTDSESSSVPTREPRQRRIMGDHERSSLLINGVTLRSREELSNYLKRWLEGQPEGTTIAKLARMARIPESTFMNYFSGHGFPGARNRTEFVALIERLTSSDQQLVVHLAPDNQKKKQPMMAEGIEAELKDLLTKVLSKFQQLTEEIHRMKDGGETAARTPLEHAEKVLALLYSLDRELQYFRDASSAHRDYLRRIVHGQDVGYITSLLRALYDEDKFQSWQLFANYQMGSGGSGRRGDRV